MRKINFKKLILVKVICFLSFIMIIMSCRNSNPGSNAENENYAVGRGLIINKNSELWKFIDTLTIIDTHEYIGREKNHLGTKIDVFRMMKSYIEMLPTNKIHAFGGDYIYPQQEAGHIKFAKDNIYLAFNDMINEGTMTLEGAKEVFYDWLYANPKSFYFK